MAEDEWRGLFRRLSSAGLMPARGMQQRLLELDDPDTVLKSAKRLGMNGILNDEMLDQLLVGPEAGVDDETPSSTVGALPPNGDAPVPDKPVSVDEPAIGRVVAPVLEPPLEVAARPHGLPHFDIAKFPLAATETDTELDIHFDITGNSTTACTMDDLLSYFNDRLQRIKRIIVQGGRLPNRPIDISRLARERKRFGNRDTTATIIGLVSEIRHGSSHLRFSLEDETGDYACILYPPGGAADASSAGRRNQLLVAGLMNDNVIGVTGHIQGDRRDVLVVDDVHLPPLPEHRKSAAPADQAVSVAFLSDLHLGSNTFLHAQWDKLVKWFHEDPLAKTVKYLILSGDVVDGVGIYPGQQGHLQIVDLYKQYEGVAKLIEQLPDWLETMILPGNHDAVRPAEPQPALDPRVQEYFNSTTFAGNPCEFSLHGVRVLSYHGVSILDFVSGMRNVTFSQPEVAMQEMLERRHLAPTWRGKTPLSPEPEDHMVIGTIPDIFVTGHVHGHYCGEHKGITLVHSSTWQDQTNYQRMLGFQPKPCILTVINLHTHESASIPFA